MSAEALDFLVVGDVNIDLVLGGLPRLPEPGSEELADTLDFRLGGSSANCACALARLGASVAFQGRVGVDHFGDFIADELARAGVRERHLARAQGQATGITVSLSLPSDRAFATYSGTVAALRIEDLDPAVLARVRHLHVGGFFLLAALRPDLPDLFARARDHGVTISLDPGWDPSQRWNGLFAQVVPLVDVLLPNAEEVVHLTGVSEVEPAARALAQGGHIVVVKQGAAGALAASSQGVTRGPAFPTAVRDTTALGDSFNAGFLLAWTRGDPLADCLRWGNAAAAICASRLGPNRYPTAAEVRELLRRADR